MTSLLFWKANTSAFCPTGKYYLCLSCAVLSHSVVSLFVTPWTVACQYPLSMVVLQARILNQIAMPSSRGSYQPRDRTQVSCIAGGFFTSWATREAPSLSLMPIHYKTHSLKNCLFSDLEVTQKWLKSSEDGKKCLWITILEQFLYHYVSKYILSFVSSI